SMHNPSAKLLIIVDDEAVRISLAAYLEDSGFEVEQASNGFAGLELFERDRPDLVICDLRMPQIDGLELIRRFTEMDRPAPVIVVSGAGVRTDVGEAQRLGAGDHHVNAHTA